MTDPARRPRHPMPDFVRDALEEHGLREAYDARPPYQRNDYVGWIARAKREDTRQRRLAQMLDELRCGDVYMKMAWGGGRPGGNAKRPSPELAEDIREAFEAAGVLEAFRDQPPSHQRQHLRHIDEAKRPETRARRIAKTCTRLQGAGS